MIYVVLAKFLGSSFVKNRMLCIIFLTVIHSLLYLIMKIPCYNFTRKLIRGFAEDRYNLVSYRNRVGLIEQCFEAHRLGVLNSIEESLEALLSRER